MLETRLSSLLSPETIALDFFAPDVASAIPMLMKPALRAAGVADGEQPTILEAIEQREKTSSTISPPLALPHARHRAVTRIVASLGLNRSGAVDDKHDVVAVVSFVSPESASAEHLRFLSSVAKLFRTRETIDELLTARSADDVIDVLRRRGA